MRSLHKLCKKISWQHLCSKSLCNVSLQDLHVRWPGKICVQDLCNTVQAVYKRSFGKIFARDLLLRSLYKISIRNPCTRSQASLSRSLRKISLTIQMSNPPQRERCDRPKVTRRLREPSQNEHHTTARAI